MKTAGIVAEYNPFHKGHALHLARTRAALGPDGGVVCVMSGSFVQRGEPAVFAKHVRAAAALRCGADLVLELPLPWALSSAEGFARGAVGLLAGLGCVDALSFGSESGDAARLRETAALLEDPALSPFIKEELSEGLSFAAARQRALERLTGRDFDWLKAPNDLLAVEYAKALGRLGSRMELLPVRREGPAHDADEGAGELLSASALRKRLLNGEAVDGFVPPAAMALYRAESAAGRDPLFLRDAEQMLLARLRTMGEADFAALPDVSEGLEKRLARAAGTAGSVTAFLSAVKTKRYAAARLRRILCCAWLGIRAGDAAGTPPYARVLALNARGRLLLREAAERGSVPLLTKPAAVRGMSEAARRLFALEVRATDLLALCRPDPAERRGGQEWERGAVIMDN